MDMVHNLKYNNKNYQILQSEQEFIIHPAAVGILPLSKSTLHCSFQCDYHVDNYRLYLDRMILNPGDVNQKQYDFTNYPVSYNGVILIGANQIKEYILKDTKPACFSYQLVTELVFEEGNLITSVDQSKAMLRIRKNLDLNLRSLQQGRDIRCILRFLNSSLVGDYRSFRFPMTRMRYLQEMKKDYHNKNFISD